MRRYELAAMFALFIVGIPVAIIVAALFTSLFVNTPLETIVIMFLCWVVGFSMFFKAKFSLIRRGKLISFGSRDMSRTNRLFYLWGYVLMGIALFLSLGIIVLYR